VHAHEPHVVDIGFKSHLGTPCNLDALPTEVRRLKDARRWAFTSVALIVFRAPGSGGAHTHLR
jgi:hypothetical protein